MPDAAAFNSLLHLGFVIVVLSLLSGAAYKCGLLIRHRLYKRVPPQVGRWMMVAVAVGICAVLGVPLMVIDPKFPMFWLVVVPPACFWLGLTDQEKDSRPSPNLPFGYIFIGLLLLALVIMMATSK